MTMITNAAGASFAQHTIAPMIQRSIFWSQENLPPCWLLWKQVKSVQVALSAKDLGTVRYYI